MGYVRPNGSLDLSAAFDVVNVELLLKLMSIIGLPPDLIELVRKWLTNRYFHVSIDCTSSCIHNCNLGMDQRLILGPILNAIFISPLLDLNDITLFADDNYTLVWTKCTITLKADMQSKLELITNWLNHSGLKINEEKTELCLFHRKGPPYYHIQQQKPNKQRLYECSRHGI